MKTSHFYFALIVGILVSLLGALLAEIGPAGWNLATVGVMIGALACFARFESRLPSLAYIPVRIRDKIIRRNRVLQE